VLVAATGTALAARTGATGTPPAAAGGRTNQTKVWLIHCTRRQKRDAGGINLVFVNTPAFAIVYIVFLAAMMRALLVKAQMLPPTCARCGQRLERRDLGEPVCSCNRR